MGGSERRSRDARIALGGALVYVVVSFFNWQKFNIFGPHGERFTLVQSEWDGIGILAGTLGLALLGWEVSRALGAQFTLRSLSEPLTSLYLALSVAVVTVITFLTHADGRNWPAWVGLALGIAVGVIAWLRARRAGVPLPALGA